MSQQAGWDPHDELEGKGCAYGWRNRQFIEGLVRDFRIFMAVAALLLTALVALGLLAVSEARSAQTSVAALQVDGAKQQATHGVRGAEAGPDGEQAGPGAGREDRPVSAKIIDIADAVAALLNAGTFSRAFTAERHVLAEFDLGALQTLRVSVVPRGLSIAPASRSQRTYDYQVDVGIQEHVASLSDVDGLLALTEEVVDYLTGVHLEDEDAMWMATENAPVYVPQHLDQERTFTSVVTITYGSGGEQWPGSSSSAQLRARPRLRVRGQAPLPDQGACSSTGRA